MRSLVDVAVEECAEVGRCGDFVVVAVAVWAVVAVAPCGEELEIVSARSQLPNKRATCAIEMIILKLSAFMIYLSSSTGDPKTQILADYTISKNV
jgi:hypothetical protein